MDGCFRVSTSRGRECRLPKTTRLSDTNRLILITSDGQSTWECLGILTQSFLLFSHRTPGIVVFMSSKADLWQLDQLFRESVALIDAGNLGGLESFLATNPIVAQERLAEPGPWLCDKFGGKLPGFFQRPYL